MVKESSAHNNQEVCYDENKRKQRTGTKGEIAS